MRRNLQPRKTLIARPLNGLCGLVIVSMTSPSYAQDAGLCDEALARVGRNIVLYRIVEESSPKKLSDLYTNGRIRQFDQFLCPGTNKVIGGVDEIDRKSDFVLLRATGGGDRVPLLATREQAGRPRRAILVDGSIVPYGQVETLADASDAEAPAPTERTNDAAGSTTTVSPADPQPGTSSSPLASATPIGRVSPGGTGGGVIVRPPGIDENLVGWAIGIGLLSLFAAGGFYLLQVRRVRAPVGLSGQRGVRYKTAAGIERATESMAGPALPSRVKITGNDGLKSTFTLSSFPISIGRREDCDLVLSDPEVSRLHARIITETGKLFIVDLASTGGTFVDYRKTSRSELFVNSEIRVGNTRLLIL